MDTKETTMSCPSPLLDTVFQYRWMSVDAIDGGCEFDRGNGAWIQLPCRPKTMAAGSRRTMTVHATLHNHTGSPIANCFFRALLDHRRVLDDCPLNASIDPYASRVFTFCFAPIAEDDCESHQLSVSAWAPGAVEGKRGDRLASATVAYGFRVGV